jgi:hypothetical protein
MHICSTVDPELYSSVGATLLDEYTAIRFRIDGIQRELATVQVQPRQSPERVRQLVDGLSCRGSSFVASVADSTTGEVDGSVRIRLLAFDSTSAIDRYRLGPNSILGTVDLYGDDELERAEVLEANGSPPLYTTCSDETCEWVNVVILSERCPGTIIDLATGSTTGLASEVEHVARALLELAEGELAGSRWCEGRDISD